MLSYARLGSRMKPPSCPAFHNSQLKQEAFRPFSYQPVYLSFLVSAVGRFKTGTCKTVCLGLLEPCWPVWQFSFCSGALRFGGVSKIPTSAEDLTVRGHW